MLSSPVTLCRRLFGMSRISIESLDLRIVDIVVARLKSGMLLADTNLYARYEIPGFRLFDHLEFGPD